MPKKNPNALDKFLSYWASLNEGDRLKMWDILTALRGPDDENDVLKRLATGRIRYHLFKDAGHRRSWNGSGVFYYLSSNDSVPNALIVNETMLTASGAKIITDASDLHFLTHIERAFAALKAFRPSSRTIKKECELLGA